MKTKTRRGAHSLQANVNREWLNGNQTLSSGGSWDHASWPEYVTTGDSVPNWRRQIALGYDATTYLEGERRYRTYSPGFTYKKRVNNFNSNVEEALTYGPLVNGFIPFASDPGSLSSVEANRQALTRFNARTLEVNQTFNGGVFLGELGQTLRGIKRPAESLFRSIGSYRREARELRATIVRSRAHLDSLSSRQRRAAVSSANRAIAGLWLEKQFHWEPLLNDIDDGAKALAELSSSSELWKIVSASASSESSVVTPNSWSLGLAGAGKATDVTVYRTSVRYKGAVGIQPRGTTVPTLENAGLTLRNFVPTMWELVPYSFVADYFSNIGDVINGWSSGGYNVRWCMVTSRKESTNTRLYTDEPRTNDTFWKYTVQTFSAPVMISGWTRVQRVSFKGPYTPSLTWEIPGMSMKWLNLAALVSARNLDRFL